MSGGAAASVATGAEVLVRTLVACGVDTCFTNPGTSEMHFVAALDRVDGMRCVLALFEGVATGAADGYARMTGRPASTLLHLGPGLGQRPRQPAQRPPRALAGRQHRRRARARITGSTIRRSHSEHRGAGRRVFVVGEGGGVVRTAPPPRPPTRSRRRWRHRAASAR